MAMRPTPRSGGKPPVYEDFRPTIEWQQDEESNSLLLIYLPGFQKEQLKVSTHGRNILRARGERLIAGNKWSRFQEDYPLPEDCDVRGMLAKFAGGILTVRIPRKREAKDASNEATKATEDTPKPSQKTEEDVSNQKKQPSPPKAAPEKTHQKAADDNSGPSAIPSVSALGKERTGITQETPPNQEMSSEKPKRSLIEKPKEPKEENDYQKISQKVEKLADRSGDAIKKTFEEPEAHKDLRPLKAEKPEKSKEKSDYLKGAREIEKVPDQVEDILREKKMKPKLQKDKGEIEPKERKSTTASSSSSSSESSDDSLATYEPQTRKKFFDLNVGAVVLVIAAFGACLSYTIFQGEAT